MDYFASNDSLEWLGEFKTLLTNVDKSLSSLNLSSEYWQLRFCHGCSRQLFENFLVCILFEQYFRLTS